MEDNQSLLMIVLKQHYRERPTVVDEAMQVMQDYCNHERTREAYEKTLNILYDKMNDLPSNIFLYFLTLVPLPERDDCRSTVMELMKQTQNSLPDNIRPILLNYINENIPPLVPISCKSPELTDKGTFVETENKLTCESNCDDQENNEQSLIISQQDEINNESADIIDITTESCKKLIDLCAEYVIRNHSYLKNFYKTKHQNAWKFVHDNACQGKVLQQCYKVIKDLNKKKRWLRMIEQEDISQDMIREEYGDSDIFLRERHLYEVVNESFGISKELENAIVKLVNE